MRTDWPTFGHDLGRSFASPDACISRLNAATLAPKWFFNTGSPVTAQPAVSGGVVYVGDFEGDLDAFRESDGLRLWRAHTRRAFVASSPIVANGVVYAFGLLN